MRVSSWVFPLLLMAVACQTRSMKTAPIRSSQSNITLEELQSIPDITAYEAVERLRPLWLQGRGGTLQEGNTDRYFAHVFVDGLRHGVLESLRWLNARDIREIRYMSGPDATTRYGTGYPAGIIQVLTKRGGGV